MDSGPAGFALRPGMTRRNDLPQSSVLVRAGAEDGAHRERRRRHLDRRLLQRSGPFIGALIAALPTAAAAAYTILAIEHPPSFIAASAVGSVATGAAVSVFALTYTLLAQRHGLLLSLGVALVVWLIAAAMLRSVAWTPLGAIALNIAVFAVTIPLSWRYRDSGPAKKFLRRAYDIPLRALAAAVVVAAVTTASYTIGSFASGMFALFPIIFCSSIVISASAHRRQGDGQHGGACSGRFPRPRVGFTAVHYLAVPFGSWWALVIGFRCLWPGATAVARPHRRCAAFRGSFPSARKALQARRAVTFRRDGARRALRPRRRAPFRRAAGRRADAANSGKSSISRRAGEVRSSASICASTTLARSMTLGGRPASFATWMP